MAEGGLCYLGIFNYEYMWHGSLWVQAKHRTSRLSIRSWLAPKYNPAEEETGQNGFHLPRVP